MPVTYVASCKKGEMPHWQTNTKKKKPSKRLVTTTVGHGKCYNSKLLAITTIAHFWQNMANAVLANYWQLPLQRISGKIMANAFWQGTGNCYYSAWIANGQQMLMCKFPLLFKHLPLLSHCFAITLPFP